MPDPAKLEKVVLKLDLGFFAMDTEWVSDPTERMAAWELYVELTTRIATQAIDLNDGVCREALNSLHALFEITRGILRRAGPSVGTEERSVGYLALNVLNRVLRPFLTRWHPRLSAWEASRPEGMSPVEHERTWPEVMALRGELEAMRQKMHAYARALAEIAGIRRRRA